MRNHLRVLLLVTLQIQILVATQSMPNPSLENESLDSEERIESILPEITQVAYHLSFVENLGIHLHPPGGDEQRG